MKNTKSSRNIGAKKKRAHDVARIDYSQLPELVIEQTQTEKPTFECGEPVLIRYEDNVTVKRHPSPFFVERIRTPVFGCTCGTCGVVTGPARTVETDTVDAVQHSEQVGEQMANTNQAQAHLHEENQPAPTNTKDTAKLFSGSIMGVSVIVHVITSKYVDHIPLHRLVGIYKREGLCLPHNVMLHWVERVAHIVAPIVHLISRDVFTSPILLTDDTTTRQLDRSLPSGIRRGHVWVYVGERGVWFDYTADWKADRPRELLQDYCGKLMCDSYRGYDYLREDKSIVLLGCMDHVRRKFEAALRQGDSRAAPPLLLFKQLYRLEELAKIQGLDADGILDLRQYRSRPLMDQLHAWLELHRGTPPKEKLGEAIQYARNQWPRVRRYLDDGSVPISNIGAEQEMRPIASGRKSWLFFGSEEAGRRSAILYSLVRTCLHTGVDPVRYMEDVLMKIEVEGWKRSRLHELLPWNWAKKHS
jgi:transposase